VDGGDSGMSMKKNIYREKCREPPPHSVFSSELVYYMLSITG
jgi:hypothetical protein